MGWLRRPSTFPIGFPGSFSSRVNFLLPDRCHCLQSLNTMLHSLYGIFAMRGRDGNDNTGLCDLHKAKAMVDCDGMKVCPLASQFATYSQQLLASHCFISLIFKAHHLFAVKVVPCCANEERGGSGGGGSHAGRYCSNVQWILSQFDQILFYILHVAGQ